jgi:hypothetical protein
MRCGAFECFFTQKGDNVMKAGILLMACGLFFQVNAVTVIFQCQNPSSLMVYKFPNKSIELQCCRFSSIRSGKGDTLLLSAGIDLGDGDRLQQELRLNGNMELDAIKNALVAATGYDVDIRGFFLEPQDNSEF